jgi:hypothetical protein
MGAVGDLASQFSPGDGEMGYAAVWMCNLGRGGISQS